LGSQTGYLELAGQPLNQGQDGIDASRITGFLHNYFGKDRTIPFTIITSLLVFRLC
jgi:hypothetical protein